MTFGQPTAEAVAADREWRQRAAQKYAENGKPRKPLRARSVKRARQEREYGKQRQRRLGLDTPCAAAHVVIEGVTCRGWADTVQHLAGRRGERLNDERFFADLCWPHHQHFDLHPTEAKRLGFQVSRVGLIPQQDGAA